MENASAQGLTWRDHPLRELMRLSLPVTVSMLSYSLMTLVDTYLVGGLGAAQLAGVGLGGTLSFTLISFGFGMLRGGKTLVSQAVGAGRRSEAGAYLGAALIAGLIFGVLAIALQWPVGLLVRRWTATPDEGRYFIQYLMIRALGCPSAMIFAALREVRYAQSDSRSPMVATIIANAVNIGLGITFIHVLHWGVPGAAVATVIAQTVEALVLALHQHRIGWGIRAMTRAHVMALVRIGLPTGVQFLLEVGAFAVLAATIASMSEAQMAAHQITLQLISFSFLPAWGIGEGASVMVGQAVGAALDDMVVALAWLTAKVVGLYTALCTVVLVGFAHPLVAAFTADGRTHTIAVSLLHVSALFLVADGLNIVARSTLRGAGDVVFPAWVGVLCSWGMTPPLAWLLGIHFGLGAFGGWLGMCGEVFLGAAIQWARLVRGGWRPFAAKTRATVLQGAAIQERALPV